MSYLITVFKTEKTKLGGRTAQFEKFSDLAACFRVAAIGPKEGSGFVRGQLKPPVRNDENATNSKLLIIDGDEGKKGRSAPRACDVHEALVKIGLNHFIYTSHSHKKEIDGVVRNKYRVVIEASEYERKDLDRNNREILRALAEMGLIIKYVKEMKSWSQIWYEPRLEAGREDVFEYYEYFDGIPWKSYINTIEDESDESDEASAENWNQFDRSDSETLHEMYENIRTGKEYHNSMLIITYQMVKDGMSKAHCKEYMRSLMDASDGVGTERWNTRYLQIDDLVDKIKDEESEKESLEREKQFMEMPPVDFKSKDKKVDDTEKEIPLPNGLLGKYIRQNMEFMRYKDKKIAFVSSMFILASICGRKFNVDIASADGMADPTALNMYFTLAAETGIGKSEVEGLVEKAYFHFAGNDGNIMDFFYKGKVTGPKAMRRIYSERRSIGFVVNEAGMEGQSKLGDRLGLASEWLNLYGQGAWNKWTSSAEFSDVENSSKSVRAAAVSRIGESTPVELKKFYRSGDNMENGLIPRECVFLLGKANHEINRNIRVEYSSDIRDKFVQLVQTCHKDINEDVLFKPHIITVDDKDLLDDMYNTQEQYRKIQLGFVKGKDGLHQRAMASRLFVKMLRYCGLITIFNKEKSSARCLVIDKDDWEWSKRIVEWEYSQVDKLVNLTMIADDDMGKCMRVVSRKIMEMLNDEVGVKDCQLNAKERKQQIIPAGKLNKLIRTKPEIKELQNKAGFRSMPVIYMILEYMARQEYIVLSEGLDNYINKMKSFGSKKDGGHDRTSKFFRVTDDFKELVTIMEDNDG